MHSRAAFLAFHVIVQGACNGGNDWSSYFEDIAGLVNTLDRQLGIANQQFCDYAIERLAYCIATLSMLKGVVSESTNGGDQALDSYELTLQELVDTFIGGGYTTVSKQTPWHTQHILCQSIVQIEQEGPNL